MNNRMAWLLVLACFGVYSEAFALNSLQGTGIADSEERAKTMALADLSSSLYVEVNSQIVVCQQASRASASDCGSKSLTATKSQLPLLGVQFSSRPTADGAIEVSAQLNPQQAVASYRGELQRLQAQINANNQRLATTLPQLARHKILNQQLSDVASYDKLRLVFSLLGGSGFAPVNPGYAEIQAQLSHLQQRADSMDYVAELITSNLVQDHAAVYVFPPTLRSAKEITPFARTLRDQINRRVKSVAQDMQRAQLTLRGEYEILDSGDIQLTYQSMSVAQRDVASYSLRVDKTAFDGIRAVALAPDFDRLLHENIAVSNAFKSELVTDRGSSDLLFNAGDNVRLLARLNQAGYFFLIGHVVQKNKRFSYLVELNDARGAYRFIRYVPPDHANRYVELGEFTVEPPFGVEHLQLVAANKDPRATIPAHDFNDASGYYVIRGSQQDTSAAVLKTRGLKSKAQQKNRQLLTHESALTFTTMH